MHKILVCPVAFNEHIKLKNVIERYLKSGVRDRTDCLIVDDASDDGTTDMIQSFAPRGIRTIRHERRQGVGAAIRTALKHARAHEYEIIVIMAGNNKDNPDEIPGLIDPLLNEGYDFIQGSRYAGAKSMGENMPGYRRVATRIHPWLMSLITGRKVTDSTNGFRAFRLSLLDHPKINIDQPWLDQYELEPYLLYKAIALGFRFKEAPVTKVYPSKKEGYTKMKPFVGWWSILRPLIYLGLGLRT
jgi:dolichol-phosphate mannosyltransferase